MKAPQLKANIDFKWIRNNKEAVSNRKCNADLELVQLFFSFMTKMLNLLKVWFALYIIGNQ